MLTPSVNIRVPRAFPLRRPMLMQLTDMHVLEDYSFLILVGTVFLSLIYIFLLDEYAVNMPAKETTPRHLRICA